eukprot:8464894-Pyramimonas_sp.AAC.1
MGLTEANVQGLKGQPEATKWLCIWGPDGELGPTWGPGHETCHLDGGREAYLRLLAEPPTPAH